MHVKGILDRLRLAKEPRAGDFGCQLQTHGTENGTLCAEPKTCTILYADRNGRLEFMFLNALHRQLRTESTDESPGDQSGPNEQSGLTQCHLQQKADWHSSSSSRRRCVCFSQHSTTAESAVAAGVHSHTVEAHNLLWILCATLARWLEAVSSTFVEIVTHARKFPGRQEVLPCCGEDVVDIEHWGLGGQHTDKPQSMQELRRRLLPRDDQEGYDAMTIRKDLHERVSYSARQTENPTDVIPPHNRALHTNRDI